MIRIDCPNCGLRDHTEFTYVGDASRSYPGLEGDTRAWVDYVFLRDNPRGLHKEFWHHVQGCRRVLRVERDTQTHKIFSVAEAAAPDIATTPDTADVADAIDVADAVDVADAADVAVSDESGSGDDA